MMRSQRFRAAVSLTLLGLVAAILLSGVDRLTREPIEQAEQRRALAMLTELVPAHRFDNDPVFDRIEQRIDGFDRPAMVHRARLGDQPVALVFDVTTHRGYSGDIRMLVALDPDGTVKGVRVLAHRETPGLGDRIEIERSRWIEQFRGRSLQDPEPDGWASERRAGQFDALTSATVTSEAVIGAVRRVLLEADSAEDRLWSAVESDPE